MPVFSEERALLLQKLSDSLPRHEECEATDLDCQARSALHLLLASRIPPTTTTTTARNPLLCPNCNQPAPSSTSPYCSDCCREEAAFVRQFRTGLESGAAFDAERQANFGQNLWRLLGAGMPRRVALILPKSLAKILARDCEICGNPAVMVDHTGSG